MDDKPANYTPYPDHMHDHTFGDTVSHLRIPLLIGATIVLAVLLIAVVYFSRMPKKETTTPVLPTVPVMPTVVVLPTSLPFPTSEASASTDFPPLYPGVEWGQEENKKIFFVNQNRDTIELNGTYIQSKTLNSYPQEIMNYYVNEMGRNQWVKTLSSGGDTGETQGFNKNAMYFNFGTKTLENDPLKYYFFIEHS